MFQTTALGRLRSRAEYLSFAVDFDSHSLSKEVPQRRQNVTKLHGESMDIAGKNALVTGAAHGIGAALLENCLYDEDGNLLSSSFSDYVPITLLNMPELKCGSLVSPSPFSYNGAKGMGEGGGAPLHAVTAALQDALNSEGVIIDESHNTPSSLFEMMRSPNAATVVRVRKG